MKDYQALLRQLEGPDLPLYDEAREAIEELLSREVVIRDTGGDDYYVGGMTDIQEIVRACAAAGVACVVKRIEGNLVKSCERHGINGECGGKWEARLR